MLNGKNIISYLEDFYYGATKYHCGWLKPKVVRGYFKADEIGQLQRTFFNELLKLGFKRTYWQLVFPEQTAGLVKKVNETTSGINEYHIRFYKDGTIDCELEVGRFNGWHWAGPREHGVDFLIDILYNKMESIPEPTKNKIKPLFGTKDYSNYCIRKRL